MSALTAASDKHRSPTVYEQRVYQVCSAIPKGKVSTYGSLAAMLKSSPRAVGQALRRNPSAPEVPCHRVVSTSLNIGGFNGTWGDPMQVKQKREMLLQEGVLFDSDTTIAAVCIITAADLERSYLKSQVVDD
ncbi:hypothetical protein ABBQ32_012138 [Trebouxia sp. C0010 RCD-2024]